MILKDLLPKSRLAMDDLAKSAGVQGRMPSDVRGGLAGLNCRFTKKALVAVPIWLEYLLL